MVCIGMELDKKLMIEELNKACLTDKEFEVGPEAWKNYEDPFFGGEITKYFEFTSDEEEEGNQNDHTGHHHKQPRKV